ncbi:arylsulfatase [Methylocella sp.]|uniref:arylsulfatase n=1 Tax=Methylocella sp. TaxID=1978226 RepID=UPI0037833D88
MRVAGFLRRVAAAACGAAVIGAAGQAFAASAPNILLILVDDMGYSDLGSYGGEIYTHNIDELAAQGVRFTNFHTSAYCAPTRSMLMTGQDNHTVGLGNMSELLADNQRGRPGYEGFLNGRSPTVATLLRAQGYHTYMAGKWHLGKTPETLPIGQGFEESVVLAEGGGDNFENKSYTPGYASLHYFEGAHPVEPPKDFYSTQFYAQKMLGYIDAHAGDGKPFFGYLAFQAVHQPHQAPRSFIDRYAHVYDAGWRAIGDVRRERQIDIGLFPPGQAASEPVSDWSRLSDDDRRTSSRRMAAYAGMVEYVDKSVGEIVAHLKAKNLLDDTVILFLSDNGGESAELMKLFPDYYARNFDLSYERIGEKGSYSEYGPGWAGASMTPFSNFKGSASEGGVRAPLIVRYPQKVAQGRVSDAFLSVVDIAPTLLELASGKPPAAGAFFGVSMAQRLGRPAGEAAERRVFAQEVAGGAAVYDGDYKLARNAPPFGDSRWRLYNLKRDPAETTDLSGQDPQRVAALRAAYDRYVKENGVVETPADYAIDAQLKKNMQRGK